MGEYWLERERELIKRHNQIIQRRKELLEETIRHTIDARHVGVADEEFERLVDVDKFWFSKKVRNERLVKEVKDTVDRVEEEASARQSTVTATRLKIQKEIYWNYVNTCLPKWTQQWEESTSGVSGVAKERVTSASSTSSSKGQSKENKSGKGNSDSSEKPQRKKSAGSTKSK
ncbi:uncharacterized protein LOC142339880 [Convolutriloba macropyga]|uniref:uncharacterized protein LOC142339880 n=1 Tax=Convolutriloba macropyga TaxID=536237 RepID=UPI003F52424B